MSEIELKVKACPECGSAEHIQATATNVGCDACRIYQNSTTIVHAVQVWNEMERK